MEHVELTEADIARGDKMRLEKIRKEPDLAMYYLEQFVREFPDTKSIVEHTLFNVKTRPKFSDEIPPLPKVTDFDNVTSPKPPAKKSIRWNKAKNLQLANSEEWQCVDIALDAVMSWCYEERQKKEEADVQLLNKRGRILYYAFSIMGHTHYSPIRTFQYGLAHFMAMVRRNGTQAERKACSFLRCNKVKWGICDILYPYASKRSNLKKQIKVMQTALKMAEEAKDENLVVKIKKTFDAISEMKTLKRFLA